MTVPPDLLSRYDVPGPRYTSYPTVPAWTRPFGPADYRLALEELARVENESISLYIHLPFCQYRCHYCACNVTIASRSSVMDHYLDRLAREIDIVCDILGRGRRALQLHLGGGTPNLLTLAQLEQVAGTLRDRFNVLPEAEQSVEADPRLVSPEQLVALRALGFQRISFGVQDFDPVVQAAIGRVQPEHIVARSVALAREAGFDGINIDLIYGLPEQTPVRFERTLETALALEPNRVACYSYAHVPQTRANQRLIVEAALPSRQQKFRLFQMAVDAFSGGGYRWIGLDHFARPDDELALAADARRLCRDFMGYTTRATQHLLGFGMSAIGDVAGRLIQNVARTGQYQRSLDLGELPIERGHSRSEEDRIRHRAIQHLMCNLELPYRLLPPPDDESHQRLQLLLADGLIAGGIDAYEVTPTGRWFLRNIAMALDAYLPEQVAASRPIFSRTV